jgi:hypothetical protein
MTPAVPIEGPAGSMAGPCTLHTIRLEFGPHPSVRALFCALGSALAGSGLVANDIDLFPTGDGCILRASCATAREPGMLAALTFLLRPEDRPASPPRSSSARANRCSLAR